MKPWPGDHDAVATACRQLTSPRLLVFPDLVRSNIDLMISMVGSPPRLRPHLKTTKMPAVVQLLLEAGVRQFKCATLSEMSMALQNGARDILLAYQAVGPNVNRLIDLARAHPDAQLGCLIDSKEAIPPLAQASEAADVSLQVHIDIDCGMHRTGLGPGPEALELENELRAASHLRFAGWHVYDGHLRQTDVTERQTAVDASFAPFWAMLESSQDPHAPVIAGGTPSFPMHARNDRVICSPGTCVFWDAGYATIVPDMTFDCAALLLTRVVSKSAHTLTFDLGHKAVSAENPIDRRAVFPTLPDAQAISQSEEHLVVQTAVAAKHHLGEALLAIPWHICPSVALYDQATTIVDGAPNDKWPIPARQRQT